MVCASMFSASAWRYVYTQDSWYTWNFLCNACLHHFEIQILKGILDFFEDHATALRTWYSFLYLLCPLVMVSNVDSQTVCVVNHYLLKD